MKASTCVWLGLLIGCGRLDYDLREDAGRTVTGDDAGGDASFDAGKPDAAAPMRDAGASDPDAEPTPDAGRDTTACDDVLSGALLCDGFEAGFSAWTMVRFAEGATIPTYRGVASMRATSSPASAVSYLFSNRIPRVVSGELYARTYLYVPGVGTPRWLAVLHLEESGDPWDYAELRMVDGELELAARSATDARSARAGAVPRDRWFCVELRVLVADGGEVELFVEGTSAAAIRATDTLHASPWQTFYTGISYRGPTQTGRIEIFYDEVVLSTTRIGCD